MHLGHLKTSWGTFGHLVGAPSGTLEHLGAPWGPRCTLGHRGAPCYCFQSRTTRRKVLGRGSITAVTTHPVQEVKGNEERRVMVEKKLYLVSSTAKYPLEYKDIASSDFLVIINDTRSDVMPYKLMQIYSSDSVKLNAGKKIRKGRAASQN